MSPRSPLEQLRRRLLATGPGPRLLGPRAALAHQLTLSACLLVGVLLGQSSGMGDPLAAVGRIALQLLLPFIAGDLLKIAVVAIGARLSVLAFGTTISTPTKWVKQLV